MTPTLWTSASSVNGQKFRLPIIIHSSKRQRALGALRQRTSFSRNSLKSFISWEHSKQTNEFKCIGSMSLHSAEQPEIYDQEQKFYQSFILFQWKSIKIAGTNKNTQKLICGPPPGDLETSKSYLSRWSWHIHDAALLPQTHRSPCSCLACCSRWCSSPCKSWNIQCHSSQDIPRRNI